MSPLLTNCSRDCAEVNRCRVGGVPCAVCGQRYCIRDLHDHGFDGLLCDKCHDWRESANIDEEEM